MGLSGGWDDSPPGKAHHKEAEAAVETAPDNGINCVDHADIYTRGKAKIVFGNLLKTQPHLRQQTFVQSKAGIRLDADPSYYDLSPSWLRSRLDKTLPSIADCMMLRFRRGAALPGGFIPGKISMDSRSRWEKLLIWCKKWPKKYQTSREAIVLAWLMRHPANIQPVIGTTNRQRIIASGQACDVHLSRADWYALYISAYGQILL